jgi:hypothetical protein
MSDVYCGQCGKYHASLTVCPNQHLQTVYTQKGTTTIDLDEMRAEITRLQAREAKLREALEACSTAIDAHFGYITRQGVSMRLAGVMARAALREEGR